MGMIIYLTSAIVSMISASAAFSIGTYHVRNLSAGLRILIALLFVGIVIDVYALVHVIEKTSADRIWLHINHLLQFSLVIASVVQMGNDVLLTGLRRVLIGSVCLYWLVFVGVFISAPEFLNLPYSTPLTYLWLLVLLAEVALQYQRTSALTSAIPETYVLFGFLLYCTGIVLMQTLKLFVPETSPSFLHVMHGIFALVKNVCLIFAFGKAVWKPQV
jgi:hypothetical protein